MSVNIKPLADRVLIEAAPAEEIEAAATKVFKFLNETYRLPVEWKEVRDPNWTKKMSADTEIVWVSAFENPKPAAPKDKNLYVVITQDGFLKGVNGDGSKFLALKDYNWIWGTALIIIASGLAFAVIRRLERKSKKLLNTE